MITIEEALKRIPVDRGSPGRSAAELAALITGTSIQLRWIDAISHRKADTLEALEEVYRTPVEAWPVSGRGLECTVIRRRDAQAVLAALTLAQAGIDSEPTPGADAPWEDQVRAVRQRHLRTALFAMVDSSARAQELLTSLLS